MISKSNCLSIAAVAIFLCATSAFAQENHGTPEQRAACAPDAFRLCSGYIPDPTRVEYCLRQNKSCANAAETPCEPAIKEITRWICSIFPRSRRFRDQLPELSRRLSQAG